MARAKKLNSGTWRTLVYSHTETVDGKPKRKYESFTADTKRESEYLASEFSFTRKRQKITGLTLGEAMDQYIGSKDGILSPTTIEGYRKIRKNYLDDIIEINISKITKEVIQNAINKEAKRVSPRTGKPLSPKTIANIHGLVSATLDMYLPELTLKTTLPAKKKRLVELPAAGDVMRAVRGTEIELPCMLAIWLSYSLSEIRGIKISSISDDGYITVKEVIVDVDGKPVHKSATKEYDRTRRSKIPPYINDLIVRQESYLRAKETGIDGYLVPMSGKGIYNRFLTVMKNNGLPHTRFHDLRHINASVMLKLGVPDKYAMERGGWSTPDTLRKVYQHTFSDERKAIDERIDSYFESIMQHEMQHAGSILK